MGIKPPPIIAAIILVALLFCEGGHDYNLPKNRGLVSALAGENPTSGRLAGDFRPAKRQFSGHNLSLASLSVLRSQVKLMEPADLAIIEFLDGKVDQAILRLSRIAGAPPVSAEVLSDFAAIYIARADLRLQDGDFVLALEKADEALEVHPNFPPALFNRALAIERLSMLHQGDAAWSYYLLVERDPDWRKEAQVHLNRLRSYMKPSGASGLDVTKKEDGTRHSVETAIENHRSLRRLLEEDVLSEWATAELSGNQLRQKELFAQFERGANLLNSRYLDPIMSDVCRSIESKEPRSLGLKHLVTGIGSYRAGLKLYGQASYAKAINSLLSARRDLEIARSPLALRARFFLACAYFYSSRYSVALREFTDLAIAAKSRNYVVVYGESLWMRGLTLLARGEPTRAKSSYIDSLNAFKSIHDFDGVAGIQNLLAELLDLQGAHSEAWSYRCRALRSAVILQEPQRLYQIYAVAAFFAAKDDAKRSAAHFAREALWWANKLGSPFAKTNILVALFSYDSSISSLYILSEAEASLARMELGASKDRVEVDVMSIKAKILMDSKKSLALLRQAIPVAEKIGYRHKIIELYEQRSQIEIRAQRWREAIADLRVCIELIEGWRREIEDWRQRVEYLEQERGIVESLIRLCLSLGQVDRAWEYSEFLKARSLLDLILEKNGYHQPRPARLGVVKARLSYDNDRLITFQSLGYSICSWDIFRNVTNFLGCVDASTVRGLSEAFREYLKQGDVARSRSVGKRLYSLLFKGVNGISAAKHLIIVPDGSLCSLPFGALVDPKNGHYILESTTLLVTPSASLYVDVMPPFSLGRIQDALIVGVDSGVVFPNMPLVNLKGISGETEELVKLYPKSTVLFGRKAFRSAVLRELPAHSVFHFSGHTVFDALEPLHSSLALSSASSKEQGGLSLEDIYGLDLRHVRTVVLSACHTAEVSTGKVEDVATFARAFLASGVPVVVGSLWEIDDRGGRGFIADIHRGIASGQIAVEALRDAQILSIKRGESPAVWSSFEAIGFYAKRR